MSSVFSYTGKKIKGVREGGYKAFFVYVRPSGVNLSQKLLIKALNMAGTMHSDIMCTIIAYSGSLGKPYHISLNVSQVVHFSICKIGITKYPFHVLLGNI